jgi:hypothetical protein
MKETTNRPMVQADVSQITTCKIINAIFSTRHEITRDRIVLWSNGCGDNARQELQQRIESALANAGVTLCRDKPGHAPRECADTRCAVCKQRNSRVRQHINDDGSVTVWHCNVPGCANHINNANGVMQ